MNSKEKKRATFLGRLQWILGALVTRHRSPPWRRPRGRRRVRSDKPFRQLHYYNNASSMHAELLSMRRNSSSRVSSVVDGCKPERESVCQGISVR